MAGGGEDRANRSARFLLAATPLSISTKKSKRRGLPTRLKNKGSLPLKEALLFQTGSDKWVQFDSWPPRNAPSRELYFHEDGKLSFDAPQAATPQSFDSYVSDPAHPVPYRHRPIDMTYPDDHPGGWPTWLVEDQRFVDNRPDVLTWQTQELSEDMTVTGSVTAKLFASTTGSDSDWIVKLIDSIPKDIPTTGSSPDTS